MYEYSYNNINIEDLHKYNLYALFLTYLCREHTIILSYLL